MAAAAATAAKEWIKSVAMPSSDRVPEGRLGRSPGADAPSVSPSIRAEHRPRRDVVRGDWIRPDGAIDRTAWPAAGLLALPSSEGEAIAVEPRPELFAVGMTTAPRPERTVFHSLAELRLGGFPQTIHLFAEPGSAIEPPPNVVVRENAERLGMWANWLQAARTLLDETSAPFLLLCEDDIKLLPCAALGLQHGMTSLPAESFGVASLYTPYHNFRMMEPIVGWHPLDLSLYTAWGSLAYCFRRESLAALLESEPVRKHAGHKDTDAVVGIACRATDRRYYCHLPSLCAHAGGEISTEGHANQAGEFLAVGFSAFWEGYIARSQSNDSARTATPKTAPADDAPGDPAGNAAGATRPALPRIAIRGEPLPTTAQPCAAAPPLDEPRIPNQMIFCLSTTADDPPWPFTFVHYLAIKSAWHVNRPERMLFLMESEPSGPWWEMAKPLLTLVPVDVPREVFGQPVPHGAHRCDVMRLMALREFGGIYLDLDVWCMRPFDNLLEHDVVMGEEFGQGLCNAVILARPNSRFIERWLAEYRWFRSRGRDAYFGEHSVRLPRLLQREPETNVTVLPPTAFFWPMYWPDHVARFFAGQGPPWYTEKSYCVHLWQQITFERYLRHLTPETARAGKSEFCRIAAAILDA